MSEKDINKDGDQFFTGDPFGAGDEKNKDFLGLPDGYFEKFSSRLFKKIEAEEELKDYPFLLSAGKNNPFAVPAGYFEMREELLSYSHLRELRTNPFNVPVNYFNASAEKILNAIEIEEEAKTYSMLSAVGKQNAFVVPLAYFEELPERIEDRISGHKVIPLYTRVKLSYRVAIAAAVALIISLGILFYKQQGSPELNNDCKTMACLSKKEILNSGYMQSMSEENIIEMIDVTALSDSLSLKKNGKTEKVDADDVSEEIDINTITEEL